MAQEIMPAEGLNRNFFEKLLPEKKQPFIKTSRDIYEGILSAQYELEDARKNLESTNDQNLVDMFIYQIKAAEMKHTHLLRMAKKEAGGEKQESE